MRMLKGSVALLAAVVLASCGGGGGDAGTSLFGAGSGTAGGTAGGGGTGGTGGGTTTPATPTTPTTPTSPTTPSGGISTVGNGVPSQRFMSISAETYNLDWGIDGITTQVNIFVADTAGNPVPNGSVVQFSTEGGQIVTSCLTTGIQSGSSVISGCDVTFNTQDYRPLDGLVRIIAWMHGDEAYKDLNANGAYDTGEPFIDSGRIFRDDDDSGAYESDKDELSIGATLTGAPGIGTSACAAAPAAVNINEIPRSISDTCDGVWGKTLIRRTIVFPVSDPRYLGIAPVAGGVSVFTSFASPVLVAAPAGTTVSVLNAPAGCTIVISPATVGTTAIGPTVHTITGTTAPAAASAPTAPDACAGKKVIAEAKFGTYPPVTAEYTFPP